MQSSKIETLPESTRKRLVQLLSLLNQREENRITSDEIGCLLGVKASLVRYDFRFAKVHQGFKNGYDVSVLKSDVKKALQFPEKDEKLCCIVGLGRLGAALLDEKLFSGSGFKIQAGFDSSVNRVEMLRSTFELFPANRIETVCKAQKIEYAFLCCPESETEKMVQRLVNAGIKGIVNYTKSVFAVPKNVKVQNVSPSAVLLNM